MKKIFLFAAAALMSVSMFADNISCADAKTKIDAGDKNEWTVEGYVTEIIDVVHPSYLTISFWMADAADGGQVFEVYHLSVKGKAAAEIPVVGDKVAVTATLKKYSPKTDVNIYETDKIKGYEIVTKGSGTRYTDEDLKAVVATVAEAETAAKALAENEVSTKFYDITCFAGTTYDWDSSYKNQNFYIVDQAGGKSDLQAYRVSISKAEDAVKKGDKIQIVGQVTHAKTQAGKDAYRLINTKMTMVERAQGIEDVVLTEKAQKVMVDGVVYIVRDGKMYNALGTQVR